MRNVHQFQGLKTIKHVFLHRIKYYSVSISIIEVKILIVHYKYDLNLCKIYMSKGALKFLIHNYKIDALGEGHHR